MIKEEKIIIDKFKKIPCINCITRPTCFVIPDSQCLLFKISNICMMYRNWSEELLALRGSKIESDEFWNTVRSFFDEALGRERKDG